MENETYKKLEVECAVCKTKFDIWITTAAFIPEMEENIRNNFHRHCPVCKIMKEAKELREA